MSKKIGILSVYNHNYGSILQAYALQNVLEEMGNTTEIIVYKKTNYVKQAMRLLYVPLLKAALKMKWKNVYCRLFQKNTYNSVLQRREIAFSKFISENMHFSQVYSGRSALIQSCKNYDCFVLGSDQVWNPMNLGGDFYTMTFIPDFQKKITYAPSFGISNIPEGQREKTAAYLKRIDKISVREQDGKRIVSEFTGRNAQIVVDPTILIDRKIWDQKKSKRIIAENYIFCYFISGNLSYREFAKRLAAKTGLKIICIPHVDEFVKADENYAEFGEIGIGPLEFVNLVSNASFVCTDSFHGSVFSTLYQKTFFTFSRYSKEGKYSTNSRLYSFLSMTGLESRMFQANQEVTEKDLENPDFSVAVQRLQEQRTASFVYLKEALE
jgi:hypothetical protein